LKAGNKLISMSRDGALQYVGVRNGTRCTVTVEGLPLSPRTDLYLHCAEGFDWGYFGAAPAQLALAIVAHHCVDNEARALACYLDFMWHIVESFPHEGWCLESEQIEAVLRGIEINRRSASPSSAKREVIQKPRP
jgi:Family of unknown function (DUF6166)